MATNVVLCLGSNAPDAGALLAEAVRRLRPLMLHMEVSTFYPTEPWPYPKAGATPQYMNGVVAAQTDFVSADELNIRLKEIEAEMGRTRSVGSVVAIDIDLVVWDDVILRPKDFKAPYFVPGYRQLGEG